jgi:CubicO group peptidase (beta-lactamase class C family)
MKPVQKPFPKAGKAFRFMGIIFFPLFTASCCSEQGLEGNWQGTLNLGISPFRVAIVIQKDDAGNFQGNFNNIDDGVYDQSFQRVSIKGNLFHAELPTGEALELQLDPGGNRLTGTLRQESLQSYQAGEGQQAFEHPRVGYPLDLSRGVDFLVPRMGREDRIQTSYKYHLPQKNSDGWEVGPFDAIKVKIIKIEEIITRILAGSFPHIHSLVIVKDGKLLLDEYFYGYGPQDEQPVQSITKSVFSILLGIASDRGLLHLEDKLYDSFPEYRLKPGWQEPKEEITLGMLLTMTSGFACDDWKDSRSCSWDMVKSPDWPAFSLSQPLSHSPGEHFAYCGACLTPLSAILARKSAMTVPAFAQKYLFNPLDIQTPRWMRGPQGITPVSFGLFLKPRDMAKLGYLFLKKGKWNGKQIISESWVERSTGMAQVSKTRTNRKDDYGLLWWERDIPVRGYRYPVFYAWGVGGQYLFVVPRLDLVCVITGGNYKSGKLGANAFKLFQDSILAAFNQ